MLSISSKYSTVLAAANVLVSGVRYPITPTLTPFTSKTVDFFNDVVFVISGVFDRSKFAARTGKSASFRNGTKPSTPSSNSWFPSDCE